MTRPLRGFALPAVRLLALALGAGAPAVAIPDAGETSADPATESPTTEAAASGPRYRR